ncbi:MAG TPA: FkbM family methyltransferase [Candidatus Angelobacter sp.]|nr:FkbM family methyltransferase [Candidatus Angelobacter sp.]
MLTTKTKIALAGLAYQTIAKSRGLLGKSKQVEVRRGGVRWRLDLEEGIDFSIYLLGAFERSTVATLRELVKAGDVVLDIGANIGAHTLGLAKNVGAAGKVYAFEPADFAFQKLLRNLALNPELERRTKASQVMLGSGAEKPPNGVYASWPLEKVDSVHPKHRGRFVSTEGAVVDTLDGFVAREKVSRINLIKMDVDGHELPVLQGGRSVLREHRPVIVMEMSPYVHAEEQNSFAAVIEVLKEFRYKIEDARNRKTLPLDAAALERLIPDGAGINVVALPDQ